MSRLTLSRQLLLFQLAVVVLVVTAVAAVSLVQGDQAFRRDQTRRMLGAAEALASEGLVRRVAVAAVSPDRADRSGASNLTQPLQSRLENERVATVSTYVIFRTADDSLAVGTFEPLKADRDVRADVAAGASWRGTSERYGDRTIEVQVPILADEFTDEDFGVDPGEVVGFIVLGRAYPSRIEVLGAAAPSIIGLLALATGIGVLGSLVLARRVKRQTLGLEPSEIAALVEQREAMLHGVREGVLGVDLGGRVAFANDEALLLLDLDDDILGRRVDDLGLTPETAAVLSGGVGAPDVVVAIGARLLVLNGLPILVRGRQTGWVTSMRDRTELLEVQQQLAETQAGTDTLRAQVHEFRNRLHAIAGMAELGQVKELGSFVHAVIGKLDARVHAASTRLEDPAVAALVVAKASRAEELGVSFDLSADSVLHQHDPVLSSDLVTVIGNLVDNAFEALATGGSVGLDVSDDGQRIVVEVTDDGKGIADTDRERLFDVGFSTKADDTRAHGYGLALTRMACARHQGTVTIGRADRTVARAELLVGSHGAEVVS